MGQMGRYLLDKEGIPLVGKRALHARFVDMEKTVKVSRKLKYFSKSEIENGETTSFWFDVWTPYGRLFDITSSRS